MIDPDAAAREVYQAMAWAAERAEQAGDGPPEWVDGGNSDAQEKARRVAGRIKAIGEREVTVSEALKSLRSSGWRVAVHNDYRINGEDMTFWLFTHPNGRWIKGEGRSDVAAVSEARAVAEKEQDA